MAVYVQGTLVTQRGSSQLSGGEGLTEEGYLQLSLKWQIEIYQVDRAERAFQAEERVSTEAEGWNHLVHLGSWRDSRR